MSLLEILPLGGAGEIGRNCTAVIQGDDILVVDVGISFPTEDQLGVEIVIPDFTFLVENQDRIRGIFLTHAHEDHIGALAYLLEKIKKVPVFATEFTHAMARRKLEERLDPRTLILKTVNPGDTVKAGALSVEFVRVTHSIPDTTALAIRTEHGIVLFTADFKFDMTPVDGKQSQISRLAELGDEGVLCLLSDSTNVERPGWGPSESSVTEGFRKAFTHAAGRILITMFASNIHRMQQAMDVAAETGRKLAVAGRRMEQTLDICTQLGLVKPPRSVRIRLEDVESYEPNQLVILTTGSQGEPMAALSQMSRGDYNRLRIIPGDTILYSARPIPGNEASIYRTINKLHLLGANVYTDTTPPIHASGHAYQEELKLMINLTKPFYLAPVHGEPRHQQLYREIAQAMGHPAHRIFELLDGTKLMMDDTKAWSEEFISGDPILIDASYKAEVSSKILRERQTLAEFGLVMIHVSGDGEISIETAGFTGDEQLLRRAERVVADRLSSLSPAELSEPSIARASAADAAKVLFQKQAQLRPMIHVTFC